MTDDIREKTRAVFLAALMVVSVFAMSASFAGSAVAQDVDDGEVEVSDLRITDNEDALLSEEVKYNDSFDHSKNVGPDLGVPSVLGPVGTTPQSYTVEVNASANNTDSSEQIVVDFSESVDAGLVVNENQSQISGNDTFFTATDGDAFDETAGVTVNNDVGEITIDVEPTGSNDDVDETITLTVALEADNPEEGLDIEDGTDTINFVGIGSEGSSASDRYVAVESGVTGISAADATNLTGSSTLPYADNVTDTGDASFAQYVGSQITLQTATAGDVIDIYEVDTNNAGEYVRGDRVMGSGTAPGNATTIDTSELGAGEYFIVFDEDAENEVLLDLRELNLQGSAPDQVTEEDTIDFEVSSDDFGAIRDSGQVMAWVLEAGDSNIGDVIHVEQGTLTGQGEETLSVDPQDDLEGTGEYFAAIVHVDSETNVLTNTVEVIEPLDQDVNIVSPTPTDDPYNRGDIFEVELDLTNVNEATVTLGDRDEQNVEINVTVRDSNGDGSASFHVNTFQIGDGPVNGDDTDDGFRDHGVRTTDSGTSIVSVDAHSGLSIGGGSANTSETINDDIDRPRVVIADGNYDLVASTGDTSYKEEGSFSTDRSLVRISQGEIGDVEAWNSPTPGDSRSISDAETVDAIQQGIEDGVVNPQDGVMANEDVLVLSVEVEGLEGLLLNARENAEEDFQSDSNVIQDFLDRSDNDIVTEAFNDAGGDVISFDTEQSPDDIEELEDQRNLPSETLEPATLALEEQDILADGDERGNLNEYYLTIQVNSDSIQEDANNSQPTADELPVVWNTSFTLDANIDDAAGDFGENDAFGGSTTSYLDWTLEEDQVELDRVGDDGVLSVPPQDDFEITGTTPIAAGTQINSETQTASGEDPPFFYPNSFTVEYVEDAPNTIAFSENFGDFAGAEFDVDMRRARQPGSLVGGGIDGQVREIAQVAQHEFTDQTRGGETVMVDLVEVNQPGEVLIENEDGDVIGSADLDEGENEAIRILLDEELEESQDLTSVIVDADGEEFDEEESEGPVRVTATYTLAGQTDAIFLVSNLDPVAATVDAGEELTVSADIENVGGAEGTQTVELALDGDVVASEEVTLEGEEDTSVSFDVTAPDEDGTYTHTVSTEDDDAQGQLTVESAEPAEFDVDVSLSSDTVEPEDDVTITGTVENTGETEGTQTVTITFDGTEEVSEELTLGAGETGEVTADVTAPAEAGDYDATVESDDDSATATLTVEEAEPDDDEDDEDDTDDEDTDDEDADDDGAGFGIAAALIALLGAALLAYRRQEN